MISKEKEIGNGCQYKGKDVFYFLVIVGFKFVKIFLRFGEVLNQRKNEKLGFQR